MRCTVVDRTGAPLQPQHFDTAVAAAAAALQAAPTKQGKKRK
jgi:hypothetical protein